MTQVSEKCDSTRVVRDIMDVVASQMATLDKEVIKHGQQIDGSRAAAPAA
jgi:hypothetical protein